MQIKMYSYIMLNLKFTIKHLLKHLKQAEEFATHTFFKVTLTLLSFFLLQIEIQKYQEH